MRRGVVACVFVAGFASSALAAPGVVVSGANLRAGPGPDYPLVAGLAPGTPAEIFGCETGWGWCDVGLDGGVRGWVSGRHLEVIYDGRPAFLPQYGAEIGVPFEGFDVGDYWGRYYRGRPFYGDEARWRGRPYEGGADRGGFERGGVERGGVERGEGGGGPGPGRGPGGDGGFDRGRGGGGPQSGPGAERGRGVGGPGPQGEGRGPGGGPGGGRPGPEHGGGPGGGGPGGGHQGHDDRGGGPSGPPH